MINIGITGQNGFIGTHLINTLKLYNNQYNIIEFDDTNFSNNLFLQKFVKKCDIIIHLAAKNRHEDENALYEININLIESLINACEITDAHPSIIFTSSIQQDLDNSYGKSKKHGWNLLNSWAKKNNENVTCLIVPNVYGPFGKPFYNSVVATFCHQLTREIEPIIKNDSKLKLIYVGELVNDILILIESFKKTIKREYSSNIVVIKDTIEINITDLLDILINFKITYFINGQIPNLDTNFARNLFHTFICYIDYLKFYPFVLKSNIDERGNFVEILKLETGGQISFSSTKPGVIRGNHFHTNKIERFAVIKGKARIKFRRVGTNHLYEFDVDSNKPCFIDMPIWHTHNITNTGTEDLYTIFWISEIYNKNIPDTYFENV
jgi:UDP-2-acetamido-2,6-beta-L-arabino-hexul-4-ose reductase